MRLVSYGSRSLLMTALAGIIAGQLQGAVDKVGRARLAVPGGRTPGPLFDVLCKTAIDWPKITVLLTDERWVDESSPRSNSALVRARLMQNRAGTATFIDFAARESTPENGLSRLTTAITPHLPLTVCLLGMGADMHTASLFPGADRLADALSPDAPPLLPMRADGAAEPRLTLTAPVLQAAQHVHILLTGKEKRAALDVACRPGTSPRLAPVQVILDQADVHFAL